MSDILDQIPRDPNVDIQWLITSLDTYKASIHPLSKPEYNKFVGEVIGLVEQLRSKITLQAAEIIELKADISRLQEYFCTT